MSSEFKQHICRSYIKFFSSELMYLQKKNDEFNVSENYFDLSVVSDNSIFRNTWIHFSNGQSPFKFKETFQIFTLLTYKNVQTLKLDFETNFAIFKKITQPIKLHFNAFANGSKLSTDLTLTKNSFLIFVLEGFNAQTTMWCNQGKTTHISTYNIQSKNNSHLKCLTFLYRYDFYITALLGDGIKS